MGKSYSRQGINIKAVFRTRYFQHVSENTEFLFLEVFFLLLHVSLNELSFLFSFFFFFFSCFDHMAPLGISKMPTDKNLIGENQDM